MLTLIIEAIVGVVGLAAAFGPRRERMAMPSGGAAPSSEKKEP